MFEQVQELLWDNLFDFLDLQEISIIKINTKYKSDFNSYLKQNLYSAYKNRIEFGVLNPDEIDHRIPEVQKWLKNILLGNFETLPSGYYLFVDGEAIAYHPGTIEAIDISKMSTSDVNIQGASIIGGAILGLLAKLFTGDSELGWKTFMSGIETPQALKISDFFKKILNNYYNSKNGRSKNEYTYKEQKRIIKTELEKAYALFGVTLNATDKEINVARKKLLFKHHPDRNMDDYEAKNKFTTEINAAFDLIMKSRKK